MTPLERLYSDTGSDYNGVLQRLGSVETVERFVKKFAEDETYRQLIVSLDNDDCESAFRAAHTLKGVCASLGFTELYKISCDAVDALRAGNIKEGKRILPRLTDEYEEIIKKIRIIPN